jgi:hypothetical protein
LRRGPCWQVVWMVLGDMPVDRAGARAHLSAPKTGEARLGCSCHRYSTFGSGSV